MSIPVLPDRKYWWLAMVDIIHIDGIENDIIPDDCVGCIAWLGVTATDEDEIRDCLLRELRADGVELIEICEIHLLDDCEDVDEQFPELMANIQTWNGVSTTVWGDLHCYLGVGEA